MEKRVTVSPVDEMLPVRKLLSLGLQHVLVMYAGTVAVPLILAVSIGLSAGDTILLINASLLTSGLATLLQCLGIWRFGARLPLIQGCSFIVLAPMVLIGKEYGISTVFGAAIACGLFTVLVAPLFSRLIRFFPPVVIGTVITIIGISLIPAAAIWLGGGNPDDAVFGDPGNLLLGFATLLFTLFIHAKSQGVVRSLSVLLGLVGGTVLAAVLGYADFSKITEASWFGLSQPLAFGLPQFHLTPILVMCLSMLIVMAETTGNVLLI
ncbi:MAG: solute carrier family 23 protein, partial [Enterobacteriaceae bacterium]